MKNINTMDKIKIKNIILLQLIVIIYTINSIIGKLSAGEEFMSMRFILFYVAEVGVLGIYALLWQQMIKRFDLSIAYANRAMALIWSAVWAVVIFHESLSIKNIIGILLVIAGTVVVNTEATS
ncbi:EamA family transporter [Lacrimispora saccharolytica]|uniref:EamA family transporter n=1 Tax=Lacrimispora saccharolytica TaxID=84030 RepID=UPI00265CE9DA|nr:EamA family transporter [Lacrimispora saccharolytica]MDY4126443.1 EamA family transporter [Lachnospiraceae bacterium]